MGLGRVTKIMLFLLSGKMFFKVSFKNGKDGQSHTLQANDEHDKRQWVSCIKSQLRESGSSSEGDISSLADPEVNLGLFSRE